VVGHKTGNLPNGAPEQSVREGIGTLISLATQLAERRDRLRLVPDFEQIAERIAAAAPGFPTPSIHRSEFHNYFATFQFGVRAFPSDEQLQVAAHDLQKRLADYDKRFHGLWISFNQLNEIVATWAAGALKHLKNPLFKLPPQSSSI